MFKQNIPKTSSSFPLMNLGGMGVVEKSCQKILISICECLTYTSQYHFVGTRKWGFSVKKIKNSLNNIDLEIFLNII